MKATRSFSGNTNSFQFSRLAPLVLPVLFLVLAACINVQSETAPKSLPIAGDNKGFAVVELFTSEGCSSCPPADQLIERISNENPDKPIYVLAYHVDYWDHQGWKDPFSAREYTDRQRMYGSWLNLPTIYTPQIVVNGSTEFVGSDANTAERVISEGLNQGAGNTLTLTGKVENGKINVDYQEAFHEKRTELLLVLVQKKGQSNVRAGENAGRHLSHVQIVRQLKRVDLTNKTASIDVPAGFDTAGWELIGLVQRTSDGRITAAAKADFSNKSTAMVRGDTNHGGVNSDQELSNSVIKSSN